MVKKSKRDKDGVFVAATAGRCVQIDDRVKNNVPGLPGP